MDIRGRNGQTLQDCWSAGPRTLVGLSAHGFPNMFTITGPQSPSVLFNMPLGIEIHCEWIGECIECTNLNGFGSIEANLQDEDKWISHVKEVAGATLLPHATSWYSGANIPSKPPVFMVYLGGGKHYNEWDTLLIADRLPSKSVGVSWCIGSGYAWEVAGCCQPDSS